jgi:hypothetical protein
LGKSTKELVLESEEVSDIESLEPELDSEDEVLETSARAFHCGAAECDWRSRNGTRS